MAKESTKSTSKTKSNAAVTSAVQSLVDLLSSGDESILTQVLCEEPVHNAAVVISSFSCEKAAFLMSKLPEKFRSQIALEIARGERILLDSLQIILSDIKKKVDELASRNYVYLGGSDFITSVLMKMKGSVPEEILNTIKTSDSDVYSELSKKMFVFEDITMLDDRSVQKVLRETDMQDLSRALKLADTKVQEKIFVNMSKRAASMLKEDMEFMGPIRKKDALESQKKMISIIARLEETGEIVIPSSGDEEIFC